MVLALCGCSDRVDVFSFGAACPYPGPGTFPCVCPAELDVEAEMLMGVAGAGLLCEAKRVMLCGLVRLVIEPCEVMGP